MHRPLIVPLVAGLVLTTGCGLLAGETTPPEPECCYNPPPPDWMYPEWAWDESLPDAFDAPPSEIVLPDGDRLVLTPGEPVGPNGTLVRRGADGAPKWSFRLPEPVARVNLHGEVLRIVSWGPISSGAIVLRLDLNTGEPVWQHPVVGLGPIDHSKYRNRIQVELMDGMFIIRGWESSGKYIEVYNADGHSMAHRVLDPGVGGSP